MNAQDDAATVKASLVSTNTCDSTTVATLQRLLGTAASNHGSEPSQSGTASKSNVTTKKSASNSTSGKRTARAKNEPIVVTSSVNSGLGPKEQYKLATDVVNVSLKVLTDSLKRRPQPSLGKTDSPQSPGKRIKDQPLKEIMNPPATRGHASRDSVCSSTSKSTGLAPSLIAVAECSRTAFAHLRTVSPQKLGLKALPPWQVEQGSLALVGKLIGLGMDALAVRELRLLKRRFEKACKSGTASAGRQHGVLEKETLASLLRLNIEAGTVDVISLLITYQAHVLKLISSSKRPSVLEEAADFLDHANPSSPCRFVLKSVDDGADAGKAARQLESLAQTMLAMCPKPAVSQDYISGDSRLSAAPDTIFKMQISALHVRKAWWNLVGHQADMDREIYEPFAHYLDAFGRRSSMRPSAIYDLAKSSAQVLLGFDTCTSERKPSKLYLIYRALSSMAQAASTYDDAQEWTGKMRQASIGSPGGNTAVSTIRSITLSVQASQSQLVDFVDKLTACLGLKMNETTSVDHILKELAGLRKVLLKLLAGTTKSSSASVGNEGTISACKMLIESGMFLHRCLILASQQIGRAPEAESQSLDSSAPQRLARSFIDSTLFAVKAWMAVKGPVEPLTEALDCCRDLAEFTPEADLESVYINLSNVYWLMYSTISKNLHEGDQIPALRGLSKSVEVLKLRPTREQESGFLSMKRERLANFLQCRGHFEQAMSCIKDSITALVIDNTLGELRDVMDRVSVRLAILASEKSQALERMLKVHHRNALKIAGCSTLYINDSLETSDIAALFEVQLPILTESLARYPNDTRLHQDLDLLLRTLLKYYNAASFPIRRIRLSSYIMTISFISHGAIEQGLVQQASNTALGPESYGSDNHLERYAPAARASLAIIRTILVQQDLSSLDGIAQDLQVLVDNVDRSESGLARFVDDTDMLISLLQVAASFLAVQGEDRARIAILRALSSLQRQSGASSSSEVAITMIEIALQYLQMDSMQESQKVLKETEDLLAGKELSSHAEHRLHHAQARLAVDTGNLVEAKRQLSTSARFAEDKQVFEKDRITRYRFLADLSHSYSLLYMELGTTNEALHCAKRSVLLYQSLMARAEQDKRQRVCGDDSIQALVNGVEDLAISPAKEQAQHPAQAPHLNVNSLIWPIAPGLFESLVNVALIHAHQGLRAEAQYYAEQARKLAKTVQSPFFDLQVCTLDTQLASMAGEGTREISPRIQEYLEDTNGGSFVSRLLYRLAAGDHSIKTGDLELALVQCKEAETVMNRLMNSARNGNIASLQIVKEVAASSEQCQARTKREAFNTKPRTGRAVKTGVQKAGPIAKPSVSQQESIGISARGALDSYRNMLLIQKAQLYLQQGETEIACQLLTEMIPSEKFELLVRHRIAESACTLLKVTEELSTDFTYNVLPESTLSLPGLLENGRGQSEDQLSSSPLIQAKKTISKPRSGPQAAKRASSSNIAVAAVLQQSRQLLSDLLSQASHVSSLSSVYQISSLTITSTMLLSATCSGDPLSQALHPVRAVCSTELPDVEAVQRQIDVVALDKQQDDIHDSVLDLSSDPEHATVLPTAATFQRSFIDIIPESWTAVSISMNEESSELYVARYHAGQGPFLLRLPMARHKPSDLDNDEVGFDFAAGRAELGEIIELSDYSCHHAPDMSVKGARTNWWAEREALDQRMHELLLNMENIWLGGFKGILSQHTRHADLLARFRRSFDNILNRHLPSRQCAKSKSERLQLDSNVLQLFIGLGDDNDGAVELDEHVLDLLYFVVDILQFNGEHNAYDEMDFDSMTIETLDAMRAYHESAATIETGEKHLILVLDKRLHCFPWESMPCLQDMNVSRVGSMLHLRERILALRRQQQARTDDDYSPDAYLVPRTSGTYILNPSADLKGTQQILEPLLLPLTNNSSESPWTSITARPPSESDFKAALSSSPIFLYFGHGSGNQYVRNRSIRKLDACSEVVWLIGCSSGTVTENGDFQPVSVPLAYLIAGQDPGQKALWERRKAARRALASGQTQEAANAPLHEDAKVSRPSKPSKSTPATTKKKTAARKTTQPKKATTSTATPPDPSPTSPDPVPDKTIGRTGLCMSIVATLWDVTDKDIDRFSVSVGHEWGLWDSSPTSNPAVVVPKTPSAKSSTKAAVAGTKTPGRAAQMPKTPGKTPGKQLRGRNADPKTPVRGHESRGNRKEEAGKRSLVQAVVKGREACYLRYLNGAAVVVYGVPTYLGP